MKTPIIEQAVNWDSYRSVFPTRYVRQGPFDWVVKMASKGARVAIDVGGGNGTRALRHVPDVWLLDPFVTLHEPWIKHRVSWIDGVAGIADIVVMRGSICYLTDQEIELAKQMLIPGGTLLFNYMYERPILGHRPFQSMIGTGIERVKVEGDTISHSLEYSISGRKKHIKHSFVYRDQVTLDRLFPGSNTVRYGKNSALRIWSQH